MLSNVMFSCFLLAGSGSGVVDSLFIPLFVGVLCMVLVL